MNSNEILEKLGECLSQINELSDKVNALADEYQKSVEAEQVEPIDEAEQAEKFTDELLEDYFSCFNGSMYYLNENSVVEEAAIYSDDSAYDLYPYLNYPNKEYAFQAQKLKKFNDMLLAFKWCYDRDYEPDWVDDDNPKYTVVWNVGANRFDYVWSTLTRCNYVYFSSEKIATKCAEWLNKIDPEGELVK